MYFLNCLEKAIQENIPQKANSGDYLATKDDHLFQLQNKITKTIDIII